MEWRWSSGDKMFKLLKFEFVIAGGGTVGHPPPTHNSSSSTSRPPYPAHHLHHASRPTPPVARPGECRNAACIIEPLGDSGKIWRLRKSVKPHAAVGIVSNHDDAHIGCIALMVNW